MKLLIRLGKTIVPLSILSYLVWRVVRDSSSLAAVAWRIDWWSVGLLAAALALVHLTAVWGWQLLVATLRQRISFRDAFVVWTMANSVRYIPGTVWQYAVRVGLGRRYSITTRDSFALIVAEGICIVFSAGAFIVLSAFAAHESFLYPSRWIVLGAYSAAVAVAASGLLPWLLRKIARLAKQDLPVLRLRASQSIPVVACYLTHYALAGAVLTCLVAAFTPYTVPVLSATGTYALAWLLGYVTVFAPGGLGVTDASLAGLLSLQMPGSAAVLIALALRMTYTASDLFFGAVGYLMFRVRR